MLLLGLILYHCNMSVSELRCTLECDLCVRKEDRESHQIQKVTKSASEQGLDLTTGLSGLFKMIDLELTPLHDEPRHCCMLSRLFLQY